MRTDDFDFELPMELIAQTPLAVRPQSRLLVLHRDSRTYEDRHFYDITEYLQPGDVLVRNNTRVIPARLFGTKEVTGAHVELLLLKQEGDIWECLVGNAKVVKVGTVISFHEGELRAECLEVRDKGIRIFRMIYEGVFMEILDRLGNVPLPPYIKEKLEDKERYQTVYAKVEGSAAAPTAGLHFTEELFEKIRKKGVTICEVTLHIGLGTFRPVDVEDVTQHHMHTEWYHMDKETAEILNQAKAEGRRIVSVGTTSTRTLESVMKKFGHFEEDTDETDIFIYPGYTFRAVDVQITNFHLPKSTLLMLVSAFADKPLIMEAYKHAVEKRYRFFSFGDSMMIL
ncbi:MAG: tRNA preQ1(34) S-adenosylmethionine ribosyltransferase-isomerase QueA [Erysipelotrichaceae bacterium]|nr:tRNA preQ1(34) S-adenosylmethionine ribosyltransferase-isomerase QueA [Erysipelotrichaceae bacterium]